MCLFSALSVIIRIKNSCANTIWPEVAPNPYPTEHPEASIGFELGRAESRNVTVRLDTYGIIWARTLCTTDGVSVSSCVTGDCGFSSTAGDCPPPTSTIVEFGLNEYFFSYSVSLVKGFNLPLTVVPSGETGRFCRATGCVVDLNRNCPEEFRVLDGEGGVVGCKNPCKADDCDGNFKGYFQSRCPRARTLVSDQTSSFLCSSAEYYDVEFCAPTLQGDEKNGYDNPQEKPHKLKNNITKFILVVSSILGITITLGGVIIAWKWHFICVCPLSCNCCNDCCNCVVAITPQPLDDKASGNV
ncbi:hypothetical protein UlMin_033127 [Ulmus minor]